MVSVVPVPNLMCRIGCEFVLIFYGEKKKKKKTKVKMKKKKKLFSIEIVPKKQILEYTRSIEY